MSDDPKITTYRLNVARNRVAKTEAELDRLRHERDVLVIFALAQGYGNATEIAAAVGVTKQRVSQIKAAVLALTA